MLLLLATLNNDQQVKYLREYFSVIAYASASSPVNQIDKQVQHEALQVRQVDCFLPSPNIPVGLVKIG